MAYMNQEKKQKIAAKLKEVLKGVPIKYSLSVKHYSTIVFTVQSASAEFLKSFDGEHKNVNPYWFKEHYKDNSELCSFLEKVIACLNTDNFDNSEPMTDYFHVGHYIDVNIGKWDKPFSFIGGK